MIVQPRASRSRVVGVLGERLKIALAAAPVEGEANAALVEFLAERLGLLRRQIEIRGGRASRRKSVVARGVSVESVLKLV